MSTELDTNLHRSQNDFLEKDLTYKIIGCYLSVHKKYGPIHKEAIYDRAFSEELEVAGLNFVAKPQIPLYSITTGKKIGTFIPDYLVERKILIELKALPAYKVGTSERQLLEYLKVSQYEIGLYNKLCGTKAVSKKIYPYERPKNISKYSVICGLL